jgi:hypothetical protein
VGAGVSEVPVRRRTGRRILIVEDNHFVARQAESVLTDACSGLHRAQSELENQPSAERGLNELHQ